MHGLIERWTQNKFGIKLRFPLGQPFTWSQRDNSLTEMKIFCKDERDKFQSVGVQNRSIHAADCFSAVAAAEVVQ